MTHHEADNLDFQVRSAAFDQLQQLRLRHGDRVPRSELLAGFEFRGARIPLIGVQAGIFKPQILPELPLSFFTSPPKPGRPQPYDDEMGVDGIIRYRYRGTDPSAFDNRWMRLAMERKAPLIYHFGLVPGIYMPSWPVYVVADDPDRLTFSIAVDDVSFLASTELSHEGVSDAGIDARRSYITITVQRRLHQEAFRQRVVSAYHRSCAVCRLRHEELLDAAHILPDRHPRGLPHVSNGMALCKLHHSAFDKHIIGIRPDLVMEVRSDVLEEEDGPMLLHGLQDCHGRALRVVPRDKRCQPDPEALAERYENFRRAVG